LSKNHTEVLVQAGKALDFVVAMIAFYTSLEGVYRKMVDNLREYELTCVHKLIPPESFQEHS